MGQENNNYNNLSDIRNEIRITAEIKRRAQCREILKDTFTTKIKTSFIFPLAEFERIFGYLWGHEIEDKSHLTEDQLIFYKMYMTMRKAILDNGNLQIRAMREALDQCDINFSQEKVYFRSKE